MAECALERDLREIVGERHVARDGARQPVHLSLETADEHRRGIALVEGERGQERVVGEPVESGRVTHHLHCTNEWHEEIARRASLRPVGS